MQSSVYLHVKTLQIWAVCPCWSHKYWSILQPDSLSLFPLSSLIMSATVESYHTNWKCCSSPSSIAGCIKIVMRFNNWRKRKKEKKIQCNYYLVVPDIAGKRLNSRSKVHLDSFWLLIFTIYSWKYPLKVIIDSVALESPK